jgi:hypothetical protein
LGKTIPAKPAPFSRHNPPYLMVNLKGTGLDGVEIVRALRGEAGSKDSLYRITSVVVQEIEREGGGYRLGLESRQGGWAHRQSVRINEKVAGLLMKDAQASDGLKMSVLNEMVLNAVEYRGIVVAFARKELVEEAVKRSLAYYLRQMRQ